MTMIKIATITPINCITHEQDGPQFSIHWDQDNALCAIFEDDHEEMLDYSAATLDDAINTVHSLYAVSNAYIYEPEEIDLELQ